MAESMAESRMVQIQELKVSQRSSAGDSGPRHMGQSIQENHSTIIFQCVITCECINAQPKMSRWRNLEPVFGWLLTGCFARASPLGPQAHISQLQASVSSAEQRVFEGELVRRKLHNVIMELKGNIRVFCRVRPSTSTELAEAGDKAVPAVAFPTNGKPVS